MSGKLTIVDYDSGFAIAAREALRVYGLEAFEWGLIDAPNLRGRRLGRVAARRRHDVGGCGGSHGEGKWVEEKLRMGTLDHGVRLRRLRSLSRRTTSYCSGVPAFWRIQHHGSGGPSAITETKAI